MHTGKGRIDEIFIQDGRAGRISCPPALIPAPGQYLLAHADADWAAPLPHPVFKAGNAAGGFIACAPLPAHWTPGTELNLSGPLGRGFSLPAHAKKVALASFSSTCSRLLSLLEPALAQSAEITLLTDTPPENLPPSLEILPLAVLNETLAWADMLAIDLPSSKLFSLLRLCRDQFNQIETQILVETALPCGGMAECGACAIQIPGAYWLACKDGPVFQVKDFK